MSEPRVILAARGAPKILRREDVGVAVARAWSLYQGPPGATLEVALLGEAEHTRLHRELLGDPAPTDVMAIPYRDPDLWGEILVNADCAARAAAARGVRVRDEALLYVVHGALHLLGFDDRTANAAVAMRAAEARVLRVEKSPLHA
jgi:probable rRNA maturation factor